MTTRTPATPLPVFAPATPAGQRAILTAYRRIARDGYPHLCPVRWRIGPAAEMAMLRRLAVQGYSDDQPTPQLTVAGVEYARALLRSLGEDV